MRIALHLGQNCIVGLLATTYIKVSEFTLIEEKLCVARIVLIHDCEEQNHSKYKVQSTSKIYNYWKMPMRNCTIAVNHILT